MGGVLGQSFDPGALVNAWCGTMCVTPGAELAGTTGDLVMNGPLGTLAWLADHLFARRSRVQAGEVVLTGSVVPPFWMDLEKSGSCEVVGAFHQLGTVRVKFLH